MSVESSTFAAESVNGFGCIDTQCIRIKVKQRCFFADLVRTGTAVRKQELSKNKSQNETNL